MKKTIISVVLAVAIVGLAIWLFRSIMEPVKFDNEYTKRRNACAEKLKGIRTLEEAYKLAYGHYCGDFDTLTNRLLTEDSLCVVSKIVNQDAIAKAGIDPKSDEYQGMTESELIRRGFVTKKNVYANPIVDFLRNGKFPYLDPDGKLKGQEEITITDEMKQKLHDLRYVPYPKGKNNLFNLQAGNIDKGGYKVPVFECNVMLTDLLSDLDNQQVRNKIAELEQLDRFLGWRVGDMTQSITDGNFE